MSELMTHDEQLALWVEGKSVHGAGKYGDCCPDFSCCKPELLAPYETRVAFRDATPAERTTILSGFLGAAIELAGKKKVHIVTGDDSETKKEPS